MSDKHPKEKLTIYLTPEALAEIRAEGERIDRPISWILERSWKLSKEKFSTIPGTKEFFSKDKP